MTSCSVRQRCEGGAVHNLCKGAHQFSHVCHKSLAGSVWEGGALTMSGAKFMHVG